MGFFERNSAVAVIWSQSVCRMVRMRLRGGICAVEKVWSGKTEDDHSMAELVAMGARALDCDESTWLVAGCEASGWGVADVTMPPLKKEELRNALVFELRKATPLPVDKLQWGYRILPGNGVKDAPLRIRLYFAKKEQWNRWMRNLEALKQLDGILPAEAALNPLGNGQAVCLPGNDNGDWLEYDCRQDGSYAIAAVDGGNMELRRALPAAVFNCTALESLPEDERLAYVPAVVLGAYAMTDCFSKDAASLAETPEKLQPHRNVTLKVIAAMLAVYCVLLVGFVIVSRLSARAAQIRQIEHEIAAVRQEMKNYAIDNKNEEKFKQLKDELTNAPAKIPEFPLVLLDITRIIEAPMWMSQALDWRNGQISFQIQSQFKDLELAARLEDSVYLGGVTERSASFSQASGMYVQKFDMTARFDDETDTERLKARQARLKRQNENRTLQNEAEDSLSDEEQGQDGDTGLDADVEVN